MHKSRRRTTAMTLTIGMAALTAAGCGDTEPDNNSATARSATDRPAKLVLPTASPELEQAVGEEHVTALTEAGCSLGTYPEEQPDHVEAGTELTGDTYPPVTGMHYEDWGAFGRYDEVVADGYVVHNLEHGGVAAWLGDAVDEATVEAIDGLLDDGEKWMVVPRPDDEQVKGLFAAAWSKGLSCPPDALEQLGPDAVATHLDAWYGAVVSTGSDAEKDIPAYAGAMKEPAPVRDISEDPPQF